MEPLLPRLFSLCLEELCFAGPTGRSFSELCGRISSLANVDVDADDALRLRLERALRAHEDVHIVGSQGVEKFAVPLQLQLASLGVNVDGTMPLMTEDRLELLRLIAQSCVTLLVQSCCTGRWRRTWGQLAPLSLSLSCRFGRAGE